MRGGGGWGAVQGSGGRTCITLLHYELQFRGHAAWASCSVEKHQVEIHEVGVRGKG